MMIIDTHSHVQMDEFRDDAAEVTKRALSEDIWMINVGVNYATSAAAVAMAQQYDTGVFAAIGLHPTEEELFDPAKYKKLAQSTSQKIVAIGEIGLDYYREPYDQHKQKDTFIQQLDLAHQLQLPVILHCRKAHNDVIDILKSQIPNSKSQLTGVVHCFTGTLEQAQQYIGMSFYIGINDIIFKFNIDDVIKNISLENIVVETDCPYLTPPQEQGRNEPLFIKHAIQKIAELKGVSFDEVTHQTTHNARQLFKI